jgi:hypothetical protein
MQRYPGHNLSRGARSKTFQSVIGRQLGFKRGAIESELPFKIYDDRWETEGSKQSNQQGAWCNVQAQTYHGVGNEFLEKRQLENMFGGCENAVVGSMIGLGESKLKSQLSGESGRAAYRLQFTEKKIKRDKCGLMSTFVDKQTGGEDA